MDPRHRIFRTMRQIAKDRGALAEDKVVEALQDDPPGWLVSARKGTPEEDKQGRDVIVETSDLGPFYLQVKSSKTGAKNFDKHQDRLHVLVVAPGERVDSLRTRLHKVLKELRRAEVRRRRHGC